MTIMALSQYGPSVEQFSREKGFSLRDSAQILMQVLTLKYISHPQARLIGGGALIFGHQNPRFSEDIDLTQVTDPEVLSSGLKKTLNEIGAWFQQSTFLRQPKKGSRTWRLLCQWNQVDTLQLHVDSQLYRAYSTHPIVIVYPGVPSFIVESLSLEELMSEKLIAVFGRKYLGGRDLFDLWFHWLRLSAPENMQEAIQTYLREKIRERKIFKNDFLKIIRDRLSFDLKNLSSEKLKRARAEWTRYLPLAFQKESIHEDILKKCHWLGAHISL